MRSTTTITTYTSCLRWGKEIGKAAIYSVFLRRISDKTRSVWVYVIYALVANAASFAAGMGIAHAVPGIF